MAVSDWHMREGWSQIPRNLCGRPRDGFTLMQLLVGLALMVIIFSLVFLPLHKSITLTQRGRQTMHMQSTVQHALSKSRGTFPVRSWFIGSVPGSISWTRQGRLICLTILQGNPQPMAERT